MLNFNLKGLISLNFFLDFVKGIAIGAGAILPGISSGVICVIFGIYETLLNCVLNFFKNIKYNFKILFPLVLGAFVRNSCFWKCTKVFILCLSSTNKICIYWFNTR